MDYQKEIRNRKRDIDEIDNKDLPQECKDYHNMVHRNVIRRLEIDEARSKGYVNKYTR
jgi:hypothetical protein